MSRFSPRHASRLLATTGIASAILLGTLAAPVATLAKGGSGVVRATGTCSAASTSKLKAKHDSGRIELEFEVDQNRNNRLWTVAICGQRHPRLHRDPPDRCTQRLVLHHPPDHGPRRVRPDRRPGGQRHDGRGLPRGSARLTHGPHALLPPRGADGGFPGPPSALRFARQPARVDGPSGVRDPVPHRPGAQRDHRADRGRDRRRRETAATDPVSATSGNPASATSSDPAADAAKCSAADAACSAGEAAFEIAPSEVMITHANPAPNSSRAAIRSDGVGSEGRQQAGDPEQQPADEEQPPAADERQQPRQHQERRQLDQRPGGDRKPDLPARTRRPPRRAVP